jgi:hypothetical protein
VTILTHKVELNLLRAHGRERLSFNVKHKAAIVCLSRHANHIVSTASNRTTIRNKLKNVIDTGKPQILICELGYFNSLTRGTNDYSIYKVCAWSESS